MDEGCASRLGGKLQAGRKVDNGCASFACSAGWKRMGLMVDSKTKWLRAALLDGLQAGRKVDEGCASRLGGKLQAGRKVDNGCAASQVRGDW